MEKQTQLFSWNLISLTGINFEDTETHPFNDIGNFAGPRGDGLTIRDNYANYFMTVGAVPFQNNYMF